MKTIGKFLKEIRLKKHYSLRKIEKGTKIKKAFLGAIEAEDWSKLPDFTVVAGFVKSMAAFLEIDPAKTSAILKRDYPPQGIPLGPKPDVPSKFLWTPKYTFWVGIGMVLAIVLGYLSLQYFNFVAPPKLTVSEPKEEATVTRRELTVAGKTIGDAVVRVNNQPVLVAEDGTFTTQIEVFEETKEIVIKAISRSGKETTISRKIKVEL